MTSPHPTLPPSVSMVVPQQLGHTSWALCPQPEMGGTEQLLV